MFQLRKTLLKSEGGKIVLLLIDGLGGLPGEDGRTELEAARLPNLSRLAQRGSSGCHTPVAPGITPGSGPAHIALFGYSNDEVEIGRGVMEAAGIGMELRRNDVAIRANFATIDGGGVVLDRRAGRLSSREAGAVVDMLQKEVGTVDGVEVLMKVGEEHRFVVVLRGDGLSPFISDTDPLKNGETPRHPSPLAPEAVKASGVVSKLTERFAELLAGRDRANVVLLRGYSRIPDVEPFTTRFKMRALSCAYYPMYRGLTRLLGFDTPAEPERFEDNVRIARERFDGYDFLFLHYKEADKAGEDGDFDAKVAALEEVDAFVPQLEELGPEVLIVTGDHSTPATYGAHSWHSVPFTIVSRWSRRDGLAAFTERECLRGSYGSVPTSYLMPLALANAGRIAKYGA